MELILYYLIKRFFLFVDEWLFYIMLYRLFRDKYYKIWFIVLLYGSGCIYTSYSNISKIERRLLDEEQDFYVFGPKSIDNIWNATLAKLNIR